MPARELELPTTKPPIADGSMVLNTHRHTWQYASVLIQSRQHPLTGQVAQIPTVVMTCGCGDILHKHIPEPIVQVDLITK